MASHSDAHVTSWCSRWILLLIQTVSILIVGGCMGNADPPRVVQGVLDLTAWDFNARGPASLSGRWEFYWRQLLEPDDFPAALSSPPPIMIEVPGFWNRQAIAGQRLPRSGYATYRLTVRLPQQKPPLALKLMDVNLAYKLWINGEFATEVGRVATTRDTTVPNRQLRLVDVPPSSRTVEIILQVACFHHRLSGITDQVVLGPRDSLVRKQGIISASILIVLGSLLIMAVYHFTIFLLRPKDLALFYFSIVCLVFSLWQIALHPDERLLGTLFPALTWKTFFQIEYLSLCLALPLIIMFLQALFPRESCRPVVRIFQALALAFIGFIIATPSHISVQTVPYYEAVFFVGVVYVIVLLSRAARQKRVGSLFLLFSMGLVLLIVINDILYHHRIIHTFFFGPWGVFILTGSYAFVLSMQFSKAFVTVDDLSRELGRKNMALSHAVKLKDEFLANTTHELRTPLAGIVGLSEALMAGIGGRLSDTAAANLRLIVNSGRRLSNLVNDLLDYSRLRHKDIHLAIQPVNPVAAVKTVLAMSRELIGGKSIDLIATIADEIPNVRADPDRLEQILFNLVGNAIKFTQRGSVTVSAEEQGGVVEIAVADTGIGMGPEDLEGIFKSYEQAPSGLATDTGGTGLGLSITRTLVELHHGRIRVESEAGKGSCFRFTLPKTWEKPPTKGSAVVEAAANGWKRRQLESVAQPATAPGQPTAHDSPESTAKTDAPRTSADYPWHVLVVDDESINRHVITAHLSLANIPVRTAASGVEALETLAQPETPGVVLLDIMMPGMNGYEVCRRLRETHTPGDLPVIMLTAKNRMADLVEGFGSGANDYLTKPFSKEELIARVKTQLKLKQAFEILKENLQLKRELALRQQTELDLKLMQRRLAEMLHAIDEAILAVNASREICYCNRAFEALTGYETQDLLGTSFHALFSDPDDRLRTAVDRMREETGLNSGIAHNFDGLTVHPVNGEPFEGNILVTPLELEDEHLYLFIVRKLPAFANDLPAAAMEIIENLNRNRNWLSSLEKWLCRLDLGAPTKIKTVIDDLKAIDLLFERLDGQISADGRNDLKRRLAVKVMNLALDYWTAVTRKYKVTLADRSRIWNIYFEKDGYARTQTLDRYLDLKTLPRRPRWKQVCATADFVLTDCTQPSPLRDELEQTLTQFRQIL